MWCLGHVGYQQGFNRLPQQSVVRMSLHAVGMPIGKPATCNGMGIALISVGAIACADGANQKCPRTACVVLGRFVEHDGSFEDAAANPQGRQRTIQSIADRWHPVGQISPFVPNPPPRPTHHPHPNAYRSCLAQHVEGVLVVDPCAPMGGESA